MRCIILLVGLLLAVTALRCLVGELMVEESRLGCVMLVRVVGVVMGILLWR